MFNGCQTWSAGRNYAAKNPSLQREEAHNEHRVPVKRRIVIVIRKAAGTLYSLRFKAFGCAGCAEPYPSPFDAGSPPGNSEAGENLVPYDFLSNPQTRSTTSSTPARASGAKSDSNAEMRCASV